MQRQLDTTSDIAILSREDASEWTGRIAMAWRSSINGIIETGRLLCEAKHALPHGAFEAMIDSDLPFKSRTAQMLMAVARDERLTNTQHVSLLPPSWGTLYELTKLPDDVFAAKLADGSVHPEMQRSDVARLIKAKPTPTPEERMETDELVKGQPGPAAAVPDGSDLIDLCRSGLALEQTGHTAESAADEVGLARNAYRVSRQIVFLTDHIKLSNSDAAIVAEAFELLAATQQYGRAWKIAEPVAIKVWGDAQRWDRLLTLADRRMEQFERTFGIVMQSCLTTDEIELPYLSAAKAKQFTDEISHARKALAAFASRIQEIHS